jgi:exosortase N
MTGLLNIPLKRAIILKPINFFVAGYVIISMLALHQYIIIGSSAFVLGVLALPFIIRSVPGKGKSNRYGWISLLFCVLAIAMPVKTLLYFSICFTLVWLRESCYGKTSILLPVLIIVSSPAFQYLMSIVSFPIRLQLTAIAGQIFRLIGYDMKVEGNILVYEGNEFSVDPACMGLNMLVASLLLGMMLVSYYQADQKKHVKMISLLAYLTCILLLNMTGNLFRIVLLVRFQILPGTISHDIGGILCLIVYVIIPSALLARMIVRKSAYINSAPTIHSSPAALQILMFVGIGLIAFRVHSSDTFHHFELPRTQITGYTMNSYQPGIVKLESKTSLVYIKYIRGFYDADHNPAICWTGSGYKFEKLQEEKIGPYKFFTATLVNETDTLYSAWWYDNGRIKTTDQFEWRMDMLRGADPYMLINMSCASREILVKELVNLNGQKTLSPFFEKQNQVATGRTGLYEKQGPGNGTPVFTN